MKPQSTATVTVVALAAMALIPLGIRYQLDSSHRSAAAADRSSQRSSHPAGDAPRPDRSTPESAPESNARTALLLGHLAHLLSTANSYDREKALFDFIAGLSREDYPDLMSQLAGLGLSPNGFYDVSRQLVEAWARVDIAAAAKWEIAIDRSQAFGANTPLEMNALRIWLRDDPEAATAWEKAAFGDGKDNPYLDWARRNNWEAETAALMKTAGRRPAPEVIAGLMSQPENERDELLGKATQEIGKRGEQAARDWLEVLSTQQTEMLKPALSELLGGRQLSPATKVELYRKYPGAADDSIHLGTFFADWAIADTAGAISALDTLPQDGSRAETAADMMRNLSLDPKNLRTTLQVMERFPDQVSDRMVVNLSENFQPGFEWSPEAGSLLEQMPRIKSELQRRQATRTILSRWLEKDPAAVRLWMNDHELPEGLRAELK